MNKIICHIISTILLISLLSCQKRKETILASATINGEAYQEKVINSIFAPDPFNYIIFLSSKNFGIYNTVLYPIDKDNPTYCIFIYLLGSKENFITGKTFKIGIPQNISLLLDATLEFNATLKGFSEIENLYNFVPEGFDGIAFCCEIFGNEYLNLRGLSGFIEIYNYISTSDFYECKYVFENNSNPQISISNGYLRLVKTALITI